MSFAIYLTGVATDLDVLTAEVGIATARNGVIVAQEGVRNREDALLALIGQFEFDTPVRFDTDRIEVTLDSFDAGRMAALPLIEIRI